MPLKKNNNIHHTNNHVHSGRPGALLAAAATDPGSPMTPQQQQELRQLARRPAATPSTVAAAVIGALALAALLVRKGRLSKGRLLELAAATVGGLLSSSCCTIQLVLNSLSLGCAGFAVLDKVRPLFLALTFSSLAYKTWRYDIRVHRAPLRSLSTWLLAAALASSPAILRAVNRRRGLAALMGEELDAAAGPGKMTAKTQPAPGPDGPAAVQQQQVVVGSGGPLKFRVTGMKCEACGNGLRNALEAMGPGVRVDVLFEEGVIYVGRGEGAGRGERELEAAVMTVVDEMGYVCERVGGQQQAPAVVPEEAVPPQ